MGKLPPLEGPKDPTISLIVGLLTGGIGLAIYFWSFVDFVIPAAIAIACVVALGTAGFVAGAIIAGLYGYFRTLESNARLAAAASTTPPAGGAPARS